MLSNNHWEQKHRSYWSKSKNVESSCVKSHSIASFYLRNKDFISVLWRGTWRMSCSILLEPPLVLSAGPNTVTLPLQRYHFVLSLRLLPDSDISYWHSHLHSTNCPRGTFCVSHLPPLAGGEPAVEGPELWQVYGQWWPEGRHRGQDSVSAQPGIPDRDRSVHLHLLANGGGLHGRRLHFYNRGDGRRRIWR